MDLIFSVITRPDFDLTQMTIRESTDVIDVLEESWTKDRIAIVHNRSLGHDGLDHEQKSPSSSIRLYAVYTENIKREGSLRWSRATCKCSLTSCLRRLARSSTGHERSRRCACVCTEGKERVQEERKERFGQGGAKGVLVDEDWQRWMADVQVQIGKR